MTVVFSDVAESTRLGGELDPETTRRVMRRYFDTASRALERHGGSVEKFIGDAVMAVFGIPAVHEDDALRAVRAVAELHESVEALNAELESQHGVRISIRTGVNTGEVVAGDTAGGQMLVTGDAVNVAARLEEAAAPGDIMIGDATRRLVRDAVRVEEVGPVAVRGKDGGVVCWRLLEVLEDVPAVAPRLDSPLVGRERELAQLQQTLQLAVDTRTPYLFTVLGVAGIGKSRLAAELAGAMSGSVRVLTGRCLAYGDGITFWPLFEIVAELVGDRKDLQHAIARHLAGEEAADLIAERLAATFGRSSETPSTEETFWAARKLLETFARERPLVVVFEDIHWGEPTFLDFLEHVADWSRDVPIFLLCLARPDLLEKRPGWGGGKLNATSMLLRPLSEEAANTLIDHLVHEAELADDVRTRITAAADGNPLFVEQMLAMMEERGTDGKLDVPPTIQALLAARLDQLDPFDRATLERGSVIGKRFLPAAVAYLSPEDERSRIEETLQLLVRKELIRPDRLPFFDEEGYAFRHQLIRDAAYAGIPKEVRATLHERFVEWIEEHAGERLVEFEEILGYHLEQSVNYRRELGRIDEHGQRLGDRAAQYLSAAGRRALARSDASAVVNLLGRAVQLLPAEASGRGALLVELGAGLVIAGDFVRAEAVLGEAVTAAEAAGDRRIELHALLERALVRALTDPACTGPELRRFVEQKLPELEELGDHLGLARAWRRIADVHWLTSQWEEQSRALERAIAYGKLAGDSRAAFTVMRIPMAIYYGPTPVRDAARRAEEMLAGSERAPGVESAVLVCLAGLRAMSGRFDEARELLARGRAIADELGYRVWAAGFSLVASDIETLAGNPAAAEEELRRGYAIFEGIGERGLLGRVAGALARALFDQGRHEEAEQFTVVSQGLGSADVASSISWRAVRARILAARGDLRAAEELADDAIRLAERTDYLNLKAAVLLDLAAVLRASGRDDEARQAATTAVALYEQKENAVALERARASLAELALEPAPRY